MSEQTISHALVLPDRNFEAWLAAAKSYLQAFERVAVVRSPAGNDLNRYRNVTAVQAPNVWYKDDALTHIRRAYPMVVLVDVISVETPDELAPILQKRVQAEDRYGEKDNAQGHLYDRFTLDWPTDARPARIVRGFSRPGDNEMLHEGVEVYSPQGSKVMAAASGKVVTISLQPTALGYGQYVQIATEFGGLNYLVTYAYLQNIAVKIGQTVAVGDEIAESGEAGVDSIKLVVQNPPYGEAGFVLPSIVDPTSIIYWQGLKVRPTVDGLRVRALPSTGKDVEILGQVGTSDWLDSMEMHGRTLMKVGVEDKWLRVRMPDGQIGYAAAWYLEARSKDDRISIFPGVNFTGMNLDIYNAQGKPAPEGLGKIGWVRLKFNVSYNPDNNSYGNLDITAAYNRYMPFYEAYAKAGRKVLLVFSHQLFGEGHYHWPNVDWAGDFIPKYADFARRAAQHFAGKGVVAVYQIWNEQDTPWESARAAVPVSAQDYANMLSQTIQAIRSVDSEALIITGGHVTGAGDGVAYAAAMIARMRQINSSILPDGIAFHPYGLGPSTSIYSNNGSLEVAIKRFAAILSDRPVWITEWGVLDQQNNDVTAGVADYAQKFLNIIKNSYSDKVAAAIWYAWAKGMDNGYGLVDFDGRALQPLHNMYLTI